VDVGAEEPAVPGIGGDLVEGDSGEAKLAGGERAALVDPEVEGAVPRFEHLDPNDVIGLERGFAGPLVGQGALVGVPGRNL
jgi:hypothetical protein